MQTNKQHISISKLFYCKLNSLLNFGKKIKNIYLIVINFENFFYISKKKHFTQLFFVVQNFLRSTLKIIEALYI